MFLHHLRSATIPAFITAPSRFGLSRQVAARPCHARSHRLTKLGSPPWTRKPGKKAIASGEVSGVSFLGLGGQIYVFMGWAPEEQGVVAVCSSWYGYEAGVSSMSSFVESGKVVEGL